MRTIIVGDVHGCRAELEALLDRVQFTSGDRLVFVGDLIARGPESLGVLDVARRTGAIVVRGNHEQRLLDWRTCAGAHASRPAATRGQPNPRPLVSRMHRALAQALRPVDWTLLETSPLWLDLPDHGARIVHAGVAPGVPLAQQRAETMLHLRTVVGDPRDARSSGTPVLWGSRYTGPPHIVFGHNAAPGLQLHPWATGLDTACVYGGRLTAMVLAAGQRVLRSVTARRALLVSEPARRVWFVPTSAPRQVA